MGISSYYHFLLVLQFFALFGTQCLAQDFPAFFVFGDSLVDTGNNNYIVSLSKANYVPYGIDFGKSTGRYTNGRTIVDIIGQELGLKDFTPPYLAPSTVGDVLHGVNYASNGGGILNKTGFIFGGRINMDAQLDNFANTRQDIISRIGNPAASELLEKALFTVVMGSNDFLDNYLISIPEQKLVSPEMFANTMISRYRLQLTRLYDLGARKIVVANVGPIGCIPFQRDLNPSAGDSCVASSNQLAMLFNDRLKSLVMELNSNLVGSKFLYADAYRILSDIIQNFHFYGMLVRIKYLSTRSYQICVLQFFALFGTCLSQNFPSNFVFGDSLVDTGNNNYIVSLSKANYVPNGIDFGKPTGRYTNGRTIVDIIGQELGLKDFTPPYLAPSTVGDVVLHGVNYASGGGGILNKTGKIFVGRINLDAQLDNFANTRQDIISRIGGQAASELLGKALFSVTIGSNDFLNNYLTPVISIPEQKLVSPEMFVDTMISRYRLQLTRLYNLDARKIVVANIGPIGCIPYQRDVNPLAGDSCVDKSNQLATLFNVRLKSLIMELSSNLGGSKFIYADVYHIVSDIIGNFESYGFENPNSACCYVAGRFGGVVPCGPTSKVCPNRSKYVFWDPYHPSEATNVIIANRLLDGDSNDIYPINIRQLFLA
ncbi:Lipase [Macleaya cordata]|uniref:Lipase n=1 Tax=Macleaya cordata TaxID=56857 RepID=A0A200QT23_MACCD|nr:Lipase [Macleaya cordata]